MDVVLDSNIFRSDISLRSKEFDILLNYLAKTESTIVIPQIVFDEIKGLYTREFTNRLATLRKAANNMNLVLINVDNHIKFYDFDIASENSKYEEFIKKHLKIRDEYIIPYNNDYLPEISRRAINRIKPSGDNGQGFRDTLIWLTIKDYCKTCREKQITFISNNHEDFAGSNKVTLDESLNQECVAENIKINYFNSLKEFIENHSTKIDFINDDWISSNLDRDSIEELAIDWLNKGEKRNIISWFQRKSRNTYEGYKALSINILSIESPTVYEMSDNLLIINVTIEAEIEIEFSFYDDEYIHSFEYEDYYSNRKRGFDSNIQYIETQLYISITIKDNNILEPELVDIDI